MVAVAIVYEGVLVFTSLLDQYRLRTPYAIPIFDTPFALVAIGIGYLCLERHRLRQDVESAAIGVTLWLTALLAIAHIVTQPDYPANPGVNPGIAPYYFFACFFAGLAGIGVAAQQGARPFVLTDRGRFWISAGAFTLGLGLALSVPRVHPLLPSLVMPPGKFTPFALWSASLVLGAVAMWVFWAGRRRLFGPDRDAFAAYLLLAALVWTVGLMGFLTSGGFRYSIPWYLAGLSRPLGIGLIFVGLLREQVWLYREARARQHDLEGLQDFSQRLLEATQEERILDDAVNTARDLLGAECAGLFLFDPTSQVLRLQAGVGWQPGTVGTVTVTPSTASFAGYTFRNREVTQAEDLDGETRFQVPEHLVSHGIRAGINVPLGVRDQPIGVLTAGYRTPHRFSDDETRALTSLAHQTALALDKVRIYAELQKNLEQLKETQAQLIQADKLTALGTLLSGMAHELNNPLSTILLSVQLLKRRHALPEATRARMDVVEQECERASRLIQQLLVFARRRPPERKRVDLNEVTRAALGLQAPTFELRGIRVVTELATVPPIQGDAHQLQQVLLNLFSNAAHAMKSTPGGVLTVRSRETHGAVVVDVADTGPGIAPEHLTRVFDPFFTTKDVGEGTGLGLSLAIGIVEAHGGTLRVENVAGAGARVTMRIPASDGRDADPSPDEHARASRGARILVIEDEAPLRSILLEVLGGLGYKVDEAATGEAAMHRLEGETYDLIALDLKLPDIDGRTIWRWLQSRHPDLATRVVFMTGDTLSPETNAFLEEAGCPVLTKPLAIEQIARTVGGLLGR
jgi:signal transduction histidine kinase/CheY-like chemotaxis protein